MPYDGADFHRLMFLHYYHLPSQAHSSNGVHQIHLQLLGDNIQMNSQSYHHQNRRHQKRLVDFLLELTLTRLKR